VREFELRFAPWTTPSRNGGVATFQDRTAGGTRVLASQGSGSLSSWYRAIACASVGSCSGASQAKTGRNRCGRVWVRGELVSGVPGGNRGDQVVEIGNSRKGGPLGEWATIKNGSRAEFVAQVVRRPDRQGSACVRACAANSPEWWRECCWAYKWRCNPSVSFELSPIASRDRQHTGRAAAGAFLCNFVSVHCSSSSLGRWRV